MTLNRFIPGDKIQQKRYNEVIAKGVITKGPFVVDNIDHYQVKWEWKEDNDFLYKLSIPEYEDLICDIPSKKYRYDLA